VECEKVLVLVDNCLNLLADNNIINKSIGTIHGGDVTLTANWSTI
jgi:hypothetical protein